MFYYSGKQSFNFQTLLFKTASILLFSFYEKNQKLTIFKKFLCLVSVRLSFKKNKKNGIFKFWNRVINLYKQISIHGLDLLK